MCVKGKENDRRPQRSLEPAGFRDMPAHQCGPFNMHRDRAAPTCCIILGRWRNVRDARNSAGKVAGAAAAAAAAEATSARAARARRAEEDDIAGASGTEQGRVQQSILALLTKRRPCLHVCSVKEKRFEKRFERKDSRKDSSVKVLFLCSSSTSAQRVAKSETAENGQTLTRVNFTRLCCCAGT